MEIASAAAPPNEADSASGLKPSPSSSSSSSLSGSTAWNRDTIEKEESNGASSLAAARYDDDEEEEEDVCRICRNPGDKENPLRYPCACSGSIKFVHQDCLLQWLNHSNARQCEVPLSIFLWLLLAWGFWRAFEGLVELGLIRVLL